MNNHIEIRLKDKTASAKLVMPEHFYFAILPYIDPA